MTGAHYSSNYSAMHPNRVHNGAAILPERDRLELLQNAAEKLRAVWFSPAASTDEWDNRVNVAVYDVFAALEGRPDWFSPPLVPRNKLPGDPLMPAKVRDWLLANGNVSPATLAVLDETVNSAKGGTP